MKSPELFDAGRVVKVYRCGQTLEVTQTAIERRASPWRKFDASHQVHAHTGELRAVRRSASRAESIDNVRKTIVKLRRLINANVDPAHNDVMLTLTYARNERDAAVVYEDWQLMRRRLVQLYGPHEYIAVIEPQRRGAWHLHVLLLDIPTLHIPADRAGQKLLNLQMYALWGHGWCVADAVWKQTNPGLYLSSYLINEKSKKRARLSLYPRGIRIYRCSSGVKRPKAEVMPGADFLAEVGQAEPDYAVSYRLVSPDGETIQIIRQAFYNFAPGQDRYRAEHPRRGRADDVMERVIRISAPAPAT